MMTWFYALSTVAFVAVHARRLLHVPRTPPHASSDWEPPRLAPTVSFLVPVWNNAAHVSAFVAAFQGLSYPSTELVLIAGGTDGSLDVAAAHAQDDVRVLEQLAGDGKQGALRRGFASCSGEIIYLSDIDCQPSDAVVSPLLRCLVEQGLDVVTGASMPLDEQLKNDFVLIQWAVAQATQPRKLMSVHGLLGRNIALTRDAATDAGSFTFNAPSGTDYALAKELLRVGHRIVFVPDAAMPTEFPADFQTYVRKQARWIRNVFVLGHRYGSASEMLAAATTIALPIALAGLAIVGLTAFAPAGFLAAMGVVHALANRVHYLRRARLRAAPATVVSHFMADQIAAVRAGWQALRGVTSW
jgi:cellulose synthase/poly-beta-1,6-N-acetylglucosamine synthase-like glycosyltransferase